MVCSETVGKIKWEKLGILFLFCFFFFDFGQRFWLSVKKLSFLLISVVIDGNIIFSTVYCLNYSIYACIHWVFLFLVEICKWAMYFTQKATLQLKQTIVHINYARGWDKCFTSFKTIHSTIVKILPYSWLICKSAHDNIIRIGLYNPPMHDQTLTQHDH